MSEKQMKQQALIIADRRGEELGEFLNGILPALVSIAGKSVIEHCVEDLWEGGARDIVVAVPPGDATIRALLGDGTRFGVPIRYIDSAERRWPSELLDEAFGGNHSRTLVARGDVLRGRCARAICARSESGCAGPVHAVTGLRYAGLARLDVADHGVNLLDWAVLQSSQAEAGSTTVDVRHAGVSTLDSVAAVYEACLGAVDGAFVGLVPDGRQVAGSGLWLAPRASVASSAHVHGAVRVGRGAEIRRGVELAGRVDIGDRCVIDDGAHIEDSVVMPGTYVGRGVRLHNAIANGPWLYRVDLGDTQHVEDPLLLAGATSQAA